jgi:eukaryotic-like serine/threonine-protein kinase
MGFVAGERIGAYEIVGPLGAGGMGEVYRARDTRLKRDVALKVLPVNVAQDPERLERFQREAELLASLNHPHIAHLYGVEHAGDATPTSSIRARMQALVMELVDGPTLAERLSEGPLPLAEATSIARQLIDALEYAHARGIVHRDLKPANIKLSAADGPDPCTVKVLDFGLAKALDTTVSGVNPLNPPTITSPMATAAGVLLGTAAYMSPEQARGGVADKRADIWAFGVVLWEMLTGRQLFPGETVSDTIAAVLRQEVDWAALPAETPARVRRLLGRCLQRDRHRRLQDIGDARLELDEVEEPLAPALQSPQVRSRSRAVFWSSVAAALLVGAAVAQVLRWPAASSGPAAAAKWRFSIPVAEFPNGGRVAALSPDGSTLAYINRLADGSNAIHVRRGDEVTARVLPGTEEAQELFFSPDGQWIGFSTNTLNKVSVHGGLPVEIARRNANGGAAWSSDGTIYFSSVTGGGTFLWKVAATGGTAIESARPEGPGQLLHPELALGERTLLFTHNTSEGLVRVVALDLTSGRRWTVVEGAADPRVIDDNRLLVSQAGRVMVAWLSGAQPTVTGGLVPFLDGVATYTGHRASLTFSRTGALVFVPGGASASLRGRVVFVDRTGNQTPIRGEGRAFWDFRPSPDGRAIAFDARDEDIMVLDIKTGATTRLSFRKEEDETPVWSPDSQRVAYTSTRGAERLIFIRNADGSGHEQKVFSAPATSHIHLRDWSRDGKTLIYDVRQIRDGSSLTQSGQGVAAAEQSDTGMDIHALDLPTGQTRVILATAALEAQGRVSPNQKWLAYTSNESGRHEVYVIGYPDGAGRWQVSVKWRGAARMVGRRHTLVLPPSHGTARGTGERRHHVCGISARTVALRGSRVRTRKPRPHALERFRGPISVLHRSSGKSEKRDAGRARLAGLAPENALAATSSARA